MVVTPIGEVKKKPTVLWSWCWCTVWSSVCLKLTIHDQISHFWPLTKSSKVSRKMKSLYSRYSPEPTRWRNRAEWGGQRFDTGLVGGFRGDRQTPGNLRKYGEKHDMRQILARGLSAEVLWGFQQGFPGVIKQENTFFNLHFLPLLHFSFPSVHS